tara:strand:+ start:511 stop:1692 length:1182 start_codon:yes stop_codon:yes gene_type:complete
MNNIKKLIVIVGSGFAGINAAIQLRKINSNLSILVIDSKSQFEFKPLLYEVFSDEIQSWEVIPSFDTIFANSGITFLRNTVKLIDLDEKFLILKDDFKVEFQYLILSTGSSPNDFSIKGVKEYAYFFNTNKDQRKLKNRLKQPLLKNNCKKIFIIGAGPSGVELACKINDLYKTKFEINIVERTAEILNNNKIFNKEEAQKTIKAKNINLLTNSSVTEIRDKEILITNKSDQVDQFPYFAIIWTAGIKSNLPEFVQKIQKTNNRISINNKLQLPSYPNVFALGDIAAIEGKINLPITAQVAMQQGLHAALNLNLLLEKENPTPFEFKDNGEMISLGIGKASISGLGLTLSGKFAFDLRRIIYASKMPNIDKSIKSAASWLLGKKSIINQFINR